MVIYLVLSPYDNLQNDFMQKLKIDRKIDEIEMSFFQLIFF
jgi:hypothetical protein